MFELIRINKRKSFALFLLMGAFLLTLGYFIGRIWFPNSEGGLAGILIAAAVWLILTLISYFSGGSILMATSGAVEVARDAHPQLFNVVEEMKIAANLPAMPKIFIIPEKAPNAFATGVKPEKCAVAVTAGLLDRLNRDELQGVIAHEISHILNRDVLFMTFSGILLGSIVLISHVFFRSMWFGSTRRYRSGSSREGGGQAMVLVLTILLAILAPIIARLLYLAISRKREYLADASAARLTRYPEGLASALEKISGTDIVLQSANDVTAPMYITSPLRKKARRKSSALTSTHPPVKERIRILRALSQGVSYNSYQAAFAHIRGGTIIPPSGLQDTGPIPVRDVSSGSRSRDKKTSQRDLGDLMRAVNNFIFLTCSCGLKIKIPPDFKDATLSCPRCHKIHTVPLTGTPVRRGKKKKPAKAVTQSSPEQTYHRNGSGWETFSCNCGQPLLLSPDFKGEKLQCFSCGRNISIS